MSVNKVILIGNLGADPETRYTQSGDAVTNIRLATSSKSKDKQTGAAREYTEWHRITFFRRLAEVSAQYLRKGSEVYIEGQIRTRKWQGQDGQDRYTTEIVGREMQMLGSRGGNGQQQGDNTQPQQGQAAPQSAQQPAQQPQPQAQPQQRSQQPVQQPQQPQPQQSQPAQPAQGDQFFDDDIPF